VGYAFATLHRPSNVDAPDTLRRLLAALGAASDRIPVLFALHPRTRKSIERLGLARALTRPFLLATEPLSYLEALGVMQSARLVMTDSGGLQEETTCLGVPCLTLRESTERPATLDHGTNTITGTDPGRILAALDRALEKGAPKVQPPPLWDGRAAERIATELACWLAERREAFELVLPVQNAQVRG
jgi:UDP-N-acetylglucosamine 2-epimerase (non-hydrolysing)